MEHILEQKNSRKQGDVGLGYAMAYMSKIGATVCLPLTDNQDYDLIFELDGGLKKVSIKTTRQLNRPKTNHVVTLKTSGGNKSGHTIKKFDNSTVDYLFVLTSHNKKYLIPSENIKVKTTLSLTKEYDKYLVEL